jgi:light-regulated signal transduction histidine kinase (bacteriophytochrome)
MNQQQLLNEITRIGQLVITLKGEKNDAQKDYNTHIANIKNMSKDIQTAIDDALKDAKVDKDSKDNILKKIKEKADEIIGKIPEDSNKNNPTIDDEGSVLTGITR